MIFQRDETFVHSFVVTKDLYKGFIELFGDKNPLHVDDTFAMEKGFHGKVMHGNILCGFLSYFIGECLPTRDVIIHSQAIQYKHAVYLDDVLAFEAKVDGIYESVNAVEFIFTFRNAENKIISKGTFQIGILA